MIVDCVVQLVNGSQGVQQTMVRISEKMSCTVDFWLNMRYTYFPVFIKGASKSHIRSTNTVSASVGRRPPGPYRGSAPGPR